MERDASKGSASYTPPWLSTRTVRLARCSKVPTDPMHPRPNNGSKHQSLTAR